MRPTPYIAGLLLFAVCWSAPGSTSEPDLTPAELPADILNECPAGETAATGACVPVRYRIDRIGRTPDGDLFLVRPDVCAADGCRTWLVTRSAHGLAHTRLSVTGELYLEHRDNTFPTVQTRLELGGNYTRYARFEWAGDRYARTETRLVYRIDDFECADEAACRAEAQEALKRNQADRAVRIWERVYGINWI